MRVAIIAVVFMLVNKQALVGARLNQQENAVHRRRNRRDQQRLRGGEVAARQRVGEHQHQDRQRKDGDQILLYPGKIHILRGELAAAQQQRETYQPAGDDHNDGVERIAHQRRRGIARGHQRGDQANLKDNHRQAKDQGAVGLAQPMRQHVGMAHHAKGAAEDRHQRQQVNADNRGQGGLSAKEKEHPQGGEGQYQRELFVTCFFMCGHSPSSPEKCFGETQRGFTK